MADLLPDVDIDEVAARLRDVCPDCETCESCGRALCGSCPVFADPAGCDDFFRVHCADCVDRCGSCMDTAARERWAEQRDDYERFGPER